jgi:regulator of protease activity HflC (stomatin/prohibitin superfamily)
MKNKIKLGIFLLVVVIMASSCGIEQVEEGNRGIKTSFGKVVGEPLSPGVYFYNPFSSDIFEMSVRESRIDGDTEAFTIDTQKVSVKYAVTYYPKPSSIAELYKVAGKDWASTLLPQVVIGVMKDAIGTYKADDIVGKREATAMMAQKKIQEALASRNVVITRLDLVNINFADEYEKAVEEKAKAVQQALAEKNRTVQVNEQALQKITTAKAEAESMRIKTAALSQNKALVQYEIAQKWDGKLPSIVMGNGNIPMINIKSLNE